MGGKDGPSNKEMPRQHRIAGLWGELRLLHIPRDGREKASSFREVGPRPIRLGRKTKDGERYVRDMTFREKVLSVVRKIPKGKSMTYKKVATKAGNPKAARAVGAIMRTNYDPNIPCHRVIRSDGSLGNYNRGGTMKKRAILQREGAL